MVRDCASNQCRYLYVIYELAEYEMGPPALQIAKRLPSARPTNSIPNPPTEYVVLRRNLPPYSVITPY